MIFFQPLAFAKGSGLLEKSVYASEFSLLEKLTFTLYCHLFTPSSVHDGEGEQKPESLLA